MNEHYERISTLIHLFLQDKINAEERAELEEWIETYPQIQAWIENKGTRKAEISDRYKHYVGTDIFNDWNKITSRMEPPVAKRRNMWWMSAAAVLLALALIGIWKFTQRLPSHQLAAHHPQDSAVIEPGSELAFLTLSDGTTIQLGEHKDQTIQEGELRLKTHDDMLDYSGAVSQKVYEHVLRVPAGGTYSIQLSDGTKVWLNADSELRFPSVFSGHERSVSLQGEAYFEVAKMASMPFRVLVNHTSVEAIGTAFNINTHLIHGQVKTILTEGVIRVKSEQKEKIIKPGYAVITGDGKMEVQRADPEEALAWKDGYFYFTGKNFKEILEDVSRWYNIGLQVNTPLGNERFKGGIKRSESITAVCTMLTDLTGYPLTVKDRKLIVNDK